MSQMQIQSPMFRLTGSQKEPSRGSAPVGTGATFLERDFLTVALTNSPISVNQSALPTPPAVNVTASTAAGSMATGSYYVGMTYLNQFGETPIGPTTQVTLAHAGEVIAVGPPSTGDAQSYRLYIGTDEDDLHLHGSTTRIGTGITQTTYSSGGTAPPVTNGSGAAAPVAAPTLTAGGTTGPNVARTEYYRLSYVTANGETTAGPEGSCALTAGQLTTITAPGAIAGIIGYNVYGSTVSGQEVKQNGSTLVEMEDNWVEPTTGLIAPGVQRAISNQPGQVNGLGVIVGMADHDYNATYGGPVGGSQGPNTDAFGRPAFNHSVFGITQGYPGISTEPQNAHFIKPTAGTEYEISLVQAWDPGMVGALVGLGIDSSSNFFVADLTLSNRVAQITAPVDGPGRGGPGDTYKRVAIALLPNAVANIGG